MARLHHRAGRDAKGLAASVALIHARTMRLALDQRCLIDRAAMRADWAVRPADRLEMLAGFIFVFENGGRKCGHSYLLDRKYDPPSVLCQVYNRLAIEVL